MRARAEGGQGDVWELQHQGRAAIPAWARAVACPRRAWRPGRGAPRLETLTQSETPRALAAICAAGDRWGGVRARGAGRGARTARASWRHGAGWRAASVAHACEEAVCGERCGGFLAIRGTSFVINREKRTRRTPHNIPALNSRGCPEVSATRIAIRLPLACPISANPPVSRIFYQFSLLAAYPGTFMGAGPLPGGSGRLRRPDYKAGQSGSTP